MVPGWFHRSAHPQPSGRIRSDENLPFSVPTELPRDGYIDEVFAIADTVTVLRDGRHMLLFQFRFPTSPFRGRLVADSVTKRVQLMTVSE